MKLLYLDCIGGIAGDMMLAALIEAGVPETELLDALRTLPIDGWQWRSERVESKPSSRGACLSRTTKTSRTAI
jgi:uncharacterized protein (DUF111 family)